jgi:hypothetical protein
MQKRIIVVILTILLLDIGTIKAQVNPTQTNNSYAKIIGSNDLLMFKSDFIPTADGNFLLTGFYQVKDSFNSPFPQIFINGFLTKINKLGNTIWNKKYLSYIQGAPGELGYVKVVELKDKSILLVGVYTNNVTNNRDLLLTKTDRNGIVLWSKTYKGKFTEPSNGGVTSDINIYDVKEDPASKDIYVAGLTGPSANAFLMNIKSNGIIKWSNIYNSQYPADRVIGIDIQNNEIRYFTIVNTNVDSLNILTCDLVAARVNKNNGNLISQKFWKPSLNSAVTSFNNDILKVVKDINGNYLISGSSCYNYGLLDYETRDTFYQAAVLELNNNLNFVRSFSINSSVPTTATYMSFDKNRNGLLSYINYPNYDTQYIVQFKDTSILKGRKIIGNTTGWTESKSINIQNSDYVLDGYTDNISFDMRLLKLNVLDTIDCLGLNDNSFYVVPLEYVPTSIISSEIITDVFSFVSNRPITAINRSLTTTQICEQVYPTFPSGGGCGGDDDDDYDRKNVSARSNKAAIVEEKLEKKNLEAIFPNPFKDFINLQVEVEEASICRINIVSANGMVQKTVSYNLSNGKNNVRIDGLGVLKAGTYFVKVSTINGELIKKIIKL